MANQSVIVDGVSKRFGLSIKDALKYGLIDSFQRLIGRVTETSLRSGEFWALNDLSFSLENGDALGIMGINGSGKTTLLRILNGTYSPDKGKVIIKGRIGALIAAGAGFSPMLSGRENIFISGTLLGMHPSEIKNKFDQIVEFSELSEFIDMPVRNYSSGMSVRLGFAIAVMGKPDVLLIDEVLAVGDMRFQKKCFERIQTLKKEGTTILLVSHSPASIWAVCNKGLLINKGRSKGISTVEDACRDYDHVNMLSRSLVSDPLEPKNDLPSDYGGFQGGTGDVIVSSLELLNESGDLISEIEYGRTFILHIHIEIREPLKNLIFRVQVDAEINKAIAIIDSFESHGEFYDLKAGKHIIDIKITNPNLRPGVYKFCPSIVTKDVGVHLFFRYDMATLIIRHISERFFYADFRSSTYLESNFSIDVIS